MTLRLLLLLETPFQQVSLIKQLPFTNLKLGTGALASNIFEVLIENRGSTFFTGADGSWTTCPSIYNFIKQYNPQVQVTFFTKTGDIILIPGWINWTHESFGSYSEQAKQKRSQP